MDKTIVKYLFTFERLIATKIIIVIYYLGLVGVVGAALGTAGDQGSFLGKVAMFFLALAIGLFFWRILCELMILSFKIYDRLGEIRDAIQNSNSSS